MRFRAIPKKRDEIPAWFMTYTDVITLLMTFFILLLTFATREPEMFQGFQTTFFSGAGTSTTPSGTHEGEGRESYLMRTRPRSSRLVMVGSEMPPMYEDPAYHTVGDGLMGLDDQYRDPTVVHHIDVPLFILLTDRGEMQPHGRQLKRMLGRQLRKPPFHVTFQVSTPDDVPQALAFARRLIQDFHIPPGQIGIGVHQGTVPAERLRIITEWREEARRQ